MRGGLTLSLRFSRLRGSLEQTMDCSRDIINIVFTCLPTKNCPHRDGAAVFFSYPFWDFSFFVPLLLLAPIPSKMPSIACNQTER